ncbi:hypothetical protein DV532_26765 (plasmid) [Pseudomonas sp. Leaf58]|uniref:hypothetical protein n=1 Tax=Pseudomonas sp. Leaf58 TaxID=1736226 RepID=UPI0006FA5551|nr:hypothetical protein [Pseudomonas sp. Leaf58]AYG47889.1 hypothetical protein DV532_26765 [Pseudomonas sp. Leaf58]KQN62547.1 hypothetical protein ASF02_10395 [Pseudomonas sp. Leaf58]
MTISVGVIYSTSSVSAFFEEGLKDDDVLNDLVLYEFETEVEGGVFLRGLDDSCGYEECVVREVEADSVTARISFGKGPSRSGKSTKVTLDSVAERIAYEKGVSEGEGWAAYHVLEPEDLQNYLDATEAFKKAVESGQARSLIDFIKTPEEIEALQEAALDRGLEPSKDQGVRDTGSVMEP